MLLCPIGNQHRANWEMWAIRMGFLFGALSYFIQHKGYDYHRIAYVYSALAPDQHVANTLAAVKAWRRQAKS